MHGGLALRAGAASVVEPQLTEVPSLRAGRQPSNKRRQRSRIVVLALRAGAASVVEPQLTEVPSLRAGRQPSNKRRQRSRIVVLAL
ncbi:MAG: hypothetical protein ACOYJG_09810, partial [Prevotella sp.]